MPPKRVHKRCTKLQNQG